MPERDGSGINHLVRDQYEVIAGTWPESYDQVVLAVDEHNEISDVYLYSCLLYTSLRSLGRNRRR